MPIRKPVSYTHLDVYKRQELSSAEPVEFRQKTINLASLAIQKKDIFRIREEMELPGGYPNIFEIFWQNCRLGETEFRISEGKLSLQGEIQLFFLYEGEGENRPVMWYEAVIPFSGVLDLSLIHSSG